MSDRWIYIYRKCRCILAIQVISRAYTLLVRCIWWQFLSKILFDNDGNSRFVSIEDWIMEKIYHFDLKIKCAFSSDGFWIQNEWIREIHHIHTGLSSSWCWLSKAWTPDIQTRKWLAINHSEIGTMDHFNLYALDFHYYRWWKIACIYRFDPYSFHANAILWWAEFMQRTAIQFILYCILQHVFACYCFHRICEVRNTKPNYTNSDRKHTHAGRERERDGTEIGYRIW